jgi:hypothetical protein
MRVGKRVKHIARHQKTTKIRGIKMKEYWRVSPIWSLSNGGWMFIYGPLER